ncbi:glycosyltransferase [Empedobacter sp.]|uniref:glycosyltransferase n=1 Tax=Empedobacter sp. TaxID=1927715 RepID=UPI00289973F2|nr:glycosyltransferase [Empedobacter sp.]
MKIVHVISSVDASTGGPARSSTSLVESLLLDSKIKRVDLYTLISENPIIKEFSIRDKSTIRFCKPTFLDYSSELKNRLKEFDCDMYHGHGLWNLPIHQMAKIAQDKNIPYIISIRGMLEPWSLTQSKLKKKIAMNLYQNKDLKLATCLHATAVSEAESIRALGYKNPIAVIPNGINLDEYPLKDFKKNIKEKNKILFLSRIHPKKGIEILIEAWELLSDQLKKDWCIDIAGNGEKSYIASLEKTILEKGLSDQINIIGSKFGQEKIDTYYSADLFILPTHSENFGIVIAEALSCGVPVITTKGTPWQDLEKYNAGSWIDIGVQPLIKELEAYLSLDANELMQMGKNGRQLIEENYSIEYVANCFKSLYEWLLNRGNKPNFII